MENFTSRVKQPWTTYDNKLVQGKTVFKNANQKLCYLYLVSYANASRIFPSMNSIAAAICSTPRTAMTIIQQLEELGLIKVERTPGKPNQYTLNDYFEVEQSTGENFSPVKNFHRTREKFSRVTSENFSPEKEKVLKEKNKKEEEDINNNIEINQVTFNEFKEYYEDIIDSKMFDSIHTEMKKQNLTWFTIEEAKRQIARMEKKGKVHIHDWASYFVGGIIKNRISEKQASAERKIREAAKQKKEDYASVPFYNWLES